MPKLAPLPPSGDTDLRRFWHPQIEMWPVGKIRPSKTNARTHSKKQRDKLFGIIRQCGFINPILVDEHGTMISGHLRKEVAEMMGLRQVAVIQIMHLTDLEKRALALAEKRIALDAGWDRETLAAELGELSVLLSEADIMHRQRRPPTELRSRKAWRRHRPLSGLHVVRRGLAATPSGYLLP